MIEQRRPPESVAEPEPAGWLVWLIRLLALSIALPTAAAALGLAVRIFRIAAGVE